MGGLFAPPTGPTVDTLLSVEVEDPKPGETLETLRAARLVILSRDTSGRFELQHRLPLPEKSSKLTVTFAILPNGNALCGVLGFTRAYELECSAANSAGASFTLKAHQLPSAYHCVCGFRVCNEWRLAVAFQDGSVRAFALNGGAFSEVCQLPPLSTVRCYEILAVRPGALCFRSASQNPDNSWTSFVDYVELDPLGHFLNPRRLLEYKGNLILPTALPFAAAPHSRVALVATDFATRCVRFYELIE